MLGAAFGAGRSSDEPSSRSHKSYDTYGHSTSHPLRYSRPFGWVAHKPHIERAAGAFAAGFMSASGAHYAGYPRQQAGPAFEQADMIMARAAVLKRSNGQLWQPARTTHTLSSTDSKISALFDFEQRSDTITSMGATPANGLRAWRDVSLGGPSTDDAHYLPRPPAGGHQGTSSASAFDTHMHAAATAAVTPAAARSGTCMPEHTQAAADAALDAATAAAEDAMGARDAAQAELRQASQELHAAARARASHCDALLTLRSDSTAADVDLTEAQAAVRLGELRAEDAHERMQLAQARHAQSEAAHSAAVAALLELDLQVPSMADIATRLGLDPAFPIDGQPEGRAARWGSLTDTEATAAWGQILRDESGGVGVPTVASKTGVLTFDNPEAKARRATRERELSGTGLMADLRRLDAAERQRMDIASQARARKIHASERRAARARQAKQAADLSLSLTLAKRLQLEEDQAGMRALAAASTTTAAATATASAPASRTTTAAVPAAPGRARAATRSVLMAERATWPVGAA